MKTWAKDAVASIVVGAILTGASGFFVTPGKLGIDVEYRGFPLAWRENVIPTHFESVALGSLILDFLFWVVVVFIVVGVAQLALDHQKEREAPNAKNRDEQSGAKVDKPQPIAR